MISPKDLIPLKESDEEEVMEFDQENLEKYSRYAKLLRDLSSKLEQGMPLVEDAEEEEEIIEDEGDLKRELLQRIRSLRGEND